jgi:hypothetical protein
VASFLLTTPQRNEIFEVAVALGLDPTEFKWSQVADAHDNVVPRIAHPGTGAYFNLGWIPSRSGGSVLIDAWPQVGGREAFSFRNWELLSTHLRAWLAAVKQERETPDFWKTAREQRAWLTSTPADFHKNTLFTPIEREQLALHLKTIADYTIKTYELNAAHQANVEERLKYLSDATARVGRFDWKNLATSTFIEIVVTLGLDPDKTQKLLGLATQLLGPFVIGAAKLLGM